jgi:hypothetical protein
MKKFLFVSLVVLAGCMHVPEQIEPTVSAAVQERYLQALPSPFKPLSEEERLHSWAREMEIGHAFARKLDLYQAITAFKRAEILLTEADIQRQLEVHYEILLCYYVACKWDDVVDTFENSPLKTADASFPALHDMLLALYDTYIHVGDERNANRMLQLIYAYFPDEAQKLYLSKALLQADLPIVQTAAKETPHLSSFLQSYAAQKKSIPTAQVLNAALPGAGYFYIGQKQSGITALLLNGLFIGASVYFFESGNIPAGIIFTSFEAGWYFGGIYGAGLEAKQYNERLYERLAGPMMNQERLFPVLRLNYAF